MSTQHSLTPRSGLAIRLHGKRRPVHAVAFDLDGTLTRPYLNFALLRQRLGIPDGDILTWLSTLSPTEHAYAQRHVEAFEHNGAEHAEWNEGAAETLQAVQAMEIPLAIITRNSRASLQAVCQRLQISNIIGITREDAPPKPDPACVHYAAERLEVAVESLLLVGDFRHDIEAGRAAGAITVLLTNGRMPEWPVTPDVVIERLPELLAYLEVSP